MSVQVDGMDKHAWRGDGKKLGSNKPTLDEILALLQVKTSHAKSMMDKYEASNEAKAQLSTLINGIIGEYEPFSAPTTRRRTYAEIARYAKNAQINEQRARAKVSGLDV